MVELVDYIESLYSDYYQNQDNKSLDEIRELVITKITTFNSVYMSPSAQLNKLAKDQRSLDPEIVELVNKHFWELI